MCHLRMPAGQIRAVSDPILKTTRIIYSQKSLCFADPYCTDQDGCRAAFEDLGYEAGGLGWEYVGDYSVHGCYGYKTGKYAGHFFYGTGGLYGNDSRLTNLELPEFRIWC